MFLISASSVMAWVMSYTGIPTAIANGMLTVSENPIVIFLMMNLILLIVTMFVDITPAILIFTPIFLPIAVSLGMDPVHFGVVLIFNMCIGTMTPPGGSVLFVGASVADVSLERVIPKVLPYVFAFIALLMVVTYLPFLSMWLPQIMGLL